MFNMAPAFTTCLFFSCFFLDRWNLVSLQGLSYPKPSFRITSGSVTVRRGNLTMRCAAQYRNMAFVLYRDRAVYPVPTQDPSETKAVFHFTDVNTGQEGSYQCKYYSIVDPRFESEPSDTVEVTLRDNYPKPSVVLSPSVVARGGTLTISCTAEYPNMRFYLYKESNIYRHVDPTGNEALFVISGVRETEEGRYECRYQPRYGPLVWSDASEHFRIRVLDLSKPPISYELVQNVEGDYKITCSALKEKTVKRFFLYKNGEKAPLTDRSPSSESQSVTFPVSAENARDGTKYRCSYQIQDSGESVESPLSDPIQIGKGKQKEMSTATTPGNDGQMPSGDSNSSNMGSSATLPIAVVCAVLLVVILGVALILYIKCKPKKAKDDIQKRNLPLNEEKKTDSLEPMYAVVTKGKTSNNIIAPEVKKQEEGGYDEGVTYAIINRDALKNQKKNAAPPFQHPEPTLYASVNIP